MYFSICWNLFNLLKSPVINLKKRMLTLNEINSPFLNRFADKQPKSENKNKKQLFIKITTTAKHYDGWYQRPGKINTTAKTYKFRRDIDDIHMDEQYVDVQYEKRWP